MRRLLDPPPSYEEAVRGMREAEDDSPAYEMICLPTEESGAVPPYEVIPGDTAPNQREDQPSESGGLSRFMNFESQELQEMTMTYELLLVQFFFSCYHVSEEIIEEADKNPLLRDS